jgi:DNA-binding FadR family transcriptional regulator
LAYRSLYPVAALHGQVAHEIGRQIVSGAIKQGELLPRESELAETYDVSRQAIREALKVLAAKGLVTSRRRAGTSVLPRRKWNLLDPDVLAWHPTDAMTPEFYNDLVELRQLIEPAAAVLAARRATVEQTENIQQALDGMRANMAGQSEFHECDMDFHAAVFAASGNSLIEGLSTIIRPVLAAAFHLQAKSDASFEHSVSLHENLLKAIRRKDTEGAYAAMEALLEDAANEGSQVIARLRPDRH